MRESFAQRSATRAPEAARQVAHNEAKFFESFYKVSIQGEPTDRMTIGGITEAESLFHYNATGNSILRAFSRVERIPAMAAARAWAEMRRRRELRLLDVGSGTGHWLDFFSKALLVTHLVGIEIAPAMVDYLRKKYAEEPRVQILQEDIARADFGPDAIGGPVDYISVIGVMFHIVDDGRWLCAVKNLAGVLKPGGLMFVGGDFGAITRNVQFHRQDDFESWKDMVALPKADEVLVNKRVRSLADWQTAIAEAGLQMVDVVRSDRDEAFTTPENDILLLRKPA